jgi:hypothetical protein
MPVTATTGAPDHHGHPVKLALAIVARLLMLGLTLGMALIPDDTHKFYYWATVLMREHEGP